jgi:predicted Zn-dependent peptidase
LQVARILAAAALCAAVASPPLPASATQVVVRQSALLPYATVALWYRAPQTGFGAKPLPGIARLAAEAIAASTPIVGTPLAARVAALGGRIAVSTYPDSVAISAVVPAAAAPEIVRVMTVAYFSPVLQDDGVRAAQRDVAQAALVHTFSSEGTVDDALLAALFADGPAHAPQLGTPNAIVAITPDDVRAFAIRAFRAQNAVLVVTGAVDATIGASAVNGRTVADGDPLASPEPAAVSAPVAQPAPVATSAPSGPALGLGWLGPAIADEREATALDFLTDYLFRPEYGTVARALPAAISLNGRFVTYHQPGVVMVTASGTGAADAQPAILAAIEGAKTPLAPDVFRAARAAFLGRILDDLSSPVSQADTLGWYTVEGNLAYAPGNGGASGAYFIDANALTPEFVAATARKYFASPAAVVTLTAPKDSQ